MKKLLFLILILTSFTVNSQNKPAFEKKIALFRFSLHTDLGKFDDNTLLNANFYKDKVINEKIKKFMDENRESITEYQNYIFEQYTNNDYIPLDFEHYEKQKLKRDLQDLYKIMMPFFEFEAINPLSLLDALFLKLSTQKIGKMAIYNVKKQVGGEIIYTKKINKNQWEIFTNSYNFICKYIYDIPKRRFIAVEIWQRKK